MWPSAADRWEGRSMRIAESTSQVTYHHPKWKVERTLNCSNGISMSSQEHWSPLSTVFTWIKRCDRSRVEKLVCEATPDSGEWKGDQGRWRDEALVGTWSLQGSCALGTPLWVSTGCSQWVGTSVQGKWSIYLRWVSDDYVYLSLRNRSHLSTQT